jgi:hypothetical protein
LTVCKGGSLRGKILKLNRNKPMNLDELEKETEKLLSLLRDRQPGLFTWRGFMKERLENIVRMAAQAGVKAE